MASLVSMLSPYAPGPTEVLDGPSMAASSDAQPIQRTRFPSSPRVGRGMCNAGSNTPSHCGTMGVPDLNGMLAWQNRSNRPLQPQPGPVSGPGVGGMTAAVQHGQVPAQAGQQGAVPGRGRPRPRSRPCRPLPGGQRARRMRTTGVPLASSKREDRPQKESRRQVNSRPSSRRSVALRQYRRSVPTGLSSPPAITSTVPRTRPAPAEPPGPVPRMRLGRASHQQPRAPDQRGEGLAALGPRVHEIVRARERAPRLPPQLAADRLLERLHRRPPFRAPPAARPTRWNDRAVRRKPPPPRTLSLDRGVRAG